MPAIASLRTSAAQSQDSTNRTANAASHLSGNTQDGKSDLQTNFQDFVAGTFYKEMLKSLNKMHGKPAYFDGGQAEKMFQGQLDQQMAENLARSHGGQFSDGLYQAFLHHQHA